MGIFGIASTILGQISSATTPNPHKQQVKQGFQLLGEDLQSGNLSRRKAISRRFSNFFPADNKVLSSHLFRARRAAIRWLPPFSQLAQDLKSGQRHGRPIGLRHRPAGLAAGRSATGRGPWPPSSPPERCDSGQSSGQQNPISTLFGQLGTGSPVRKFVRRPTGILLPPARLPAIRAQQFHVIRSAFRRLRGKLQRLRLTHYFNLHLRGTLPPPIPHNSFRHTTTPWPLTLPRPHRTMAKRENIGQSAPSNGYGT